MNRALRITARHRRSSGAAACGRRRGALRRWRRSATRQPARAQAARRKTQRISGARRACRGPEAFVPARVGGTGERDRCKWNRIECPNCQHRTRSELRKQLLGRELRELVLVLADLVDVDVREARRPRTSRSARGRAPDRGRTASPSRRLPRRSSPPRPRSPTASRAPARAALSARDSATAASHAGDRPLRRRRRRSASSRSFACPCRRPLERLDVLRFGSGRDEAVADPTGKRGGFRSARRDEDRSGGSSGSVYRRA